MGVVSRLGIRSMAALGFVVLTAAAGAAESGEGFTVQLRPIADRKLVFATVESVDVVAARARIGGTIAALEVDEGAKVARGDVLAIVGDEKLALRLRGIDAQIAASQAELEQAEAELGRVERLFKSGTVSKARFDDARTRVSVAANALKSHEAERGVVARQLEEGQVLAPTTGRVLRVPVTAGTVLMPGETLAVVAAETYMLRLRLPERHARFVEVGGTVRLRGPGGALARTGTVRQVYPEIDNGRIVADAEVEGLGDYFVGERVRVEIATGMREATFVPARYLITRYGVDFVRVETDGSVLDVPVQRGVAHPLPDMDDAVEVLSGVRPGDRLVLP